VKTIIICFLVSISFTASAMTKEFSTELEFVEPLAPDFTAEYNLYMAYFERGTSPDLNELKSLMGTYKGKCFSKRSVGSNSTLHNTNNYMKLSPIGVDDIGYFYRTIANDYTDEILFQGGYPVEYTNIGTRRRPKYATFVSENTVFQNRDGSRESTVDRFELRKYGEVFIVSYFSDARNSVVCYTDTKIE
jgi:hypothetical protein